MSVFILSVLLCSCHLKIASAASANRNEATSIEDVFYVPRTFNEHALKNLADVMTDDGSNPTTPFDESPFMRTAEKWFNVDLGTLAATLPANNLSEPLLGWHVTIYSKSEMPYQQICGGSLVKKDVAISAAHCFWDEAGLIPAKQFAVAGGKIKRAWHLLQVNEANVSEIIVPPRFHGIDTNFQDDIAVVKFDKPFSYDFGVRPLCVDFNVDLERKQLKNGNLGTILGFGLTEENGEASDVLNYQNLPYMEINDCIKAIEASEPGFLKYLTSDKICAGDQRSGRALCRGDSGGGLVFFVGDSNATTSVPYLRGIASTAARNQHKCNAYAIGTFTDVRTHSTFLRENIPGLEDECAIVFADELVLVKRQYENQNKNMSDDKNDIQTEVTKAQGLSGVNVVSLVPGRQLPGKVDVTLKASRPDIVEAELNNKLPDNNLPDGEDLDYESNTDVKNDDNKTENEENVDVIRTLPKHAPTLGASSAPAYQWHVAVYSKFRSPYRQICGGTLVKTNVIISAAHCFFNQSHLLAPELFAVVAGKLYRHWGDPRDEYAQYSDVKQIHVHNEFLTIKNNMGSCYQHDVAVLTLATPFTYAPGVMPVCVSFELQLDLEHLQSGSFGKFVGWGRTDNDCKLYPRLSYRELPYVDLGCIPDNPLSPVKPNQACAVLDIVLGDESVPAYVKVPPPCSSDSGGGLTYLENSTYTPYLRGVATIHPVNKCNLFILDSFTKLRDEQEFLKAFIPGLEAECAVAYPVMGKGAQISGADTEETKGPGENGNAIAPGAGVQPNVDVNKPNDATVRTNGLKPISNGLPISDPHNLNLGVKVVPPNIVEPSSQRPNMAGNSNVNNIQIADFDNIPFADPSKDLSKLNRLDMRSKNQTTTEKPVEQEYSYPTMGSMTVPALGNSSEPSFQWHVGVYSKAWTPYMQICGGSLVKRNVVLSAAHCFWSDEFGPQSPAQFAVAAGKLHRPWIDSRDTDAQYSHVRELIFPDRFVGIKTNFQDDIAVVRLVTPFEYRPKVKPICVDFDMEAEKQQLKKGSLGMLAGWGLTKNDGRLSQRLNYVELPYVEIKECIRNIEPHFLKYITSDKICAGDQRNGKYLCKSDAGGGFAFIETHPIIRGINSQVFGDLCRYVTIAPQFTLISSHSTFLRENIIDIERECIDVYGIADKRINRYTGLGIGNANINLVCNCNCDDPHRYRP